MKIFLGILIGLIWGAVGALANGRIMKISVEKNSSKAVLGGNALRTLVDIIVLTVVFLIRNILPVNFVACIVATAAALSFGIIFFSFQMMKK